MYDMAYRSRGEGAADGGRGRLQAAAGGEVEGRGGGGIVAAASRKLNQNSPVALNNAEVELWFFFPPKLKHSAVQ